MKKIDKAMYSPSEIEKKWQKKWEESGVYRPDLDHAKRPFYNLMMFPYPSAEGMHVGNMYAFTGSDIYGRFKRMQGYDVFEPMGLDGFGIHSENYALKVGRHPKEQAILSEKNFYRQLKATGNAFDWSRTVETYNPGYYKWTQWIFTKLFEAGLAYKKKAPVNYCPSDKTVLADEQVIDGKCERCGSVVEKKMLEQWFFRITDYAERLLNNIEDLDWAKKVKIAQTNWIGKKEGINITYQVKGSREAVVCFTTRPDTNFGATFIVLGPEHPLIAKITTPEHKKEIESYSKKSLKQSENDRVAQGRKKTGAFTGSYAINNLTGSELPIWVSDFVIGNVGTGAVVGVPAHDLRDFEFAKAFDIPIIRVVVGADGDTSEITDEKQVQEQAGTMINSEFLDGMEIHAAKEKIMDYLEEKGFGKRVTSYHLRDWLISRQRYWGPPIPMIDCPKCGWQPVPEKDLPVLLPDVENWKPMGAGESPLATVPEFVNTTCPKCGGKAKRETDVSDTFLDSAWYFLRYTSTEFDNEAWSKDRVKEWMPVTMYIGGAEHSVLHLLYSRFLSMVFKDLGYYDHFEEPFARFYAHGLLIKEGHKMSKSKGNVVIPDEYIGKFGADTLRTYLMFLGPFSMGGDFYDTGIEGVFRFLKRVWVLIENNKDSNAEQSESEKRIMHKTVAKVTADMEGLRYNTAIASLMEWYNALIKQKTASKISLKAYLQLLAPFAPHVTEEMWESMKGKGGRVKGEDSIHTSSWPVADPKYLEESEVTIAVQINGKLRDTVVVSKSATQKDVEKEVVKSEKVSKFLEHGKVQHIVFVPGKIINFVL